jgi:LuxR family transcriptional regulator, maltose regulon positive regulatory protein
MEQRQELEKLARGRTVTVRSAQRAKMMLMAASGLTDSAIAEELSVSRHNVARWRGRFLERGIAGIEKDAPRVLGASRRSLPSECSVGIRAGK